MAAWDKIQSGFLSFKNWIIEGIESIASAGSRLLADMVPEFLKSGFEATANFLGFDKTGSGSALATVSRSLSNRTNNQSIYSPSTQSVKVSVNVKSGANPREIGTEVSRMVRRELENDRRNALEGLVQLAPSGA